MTFVGLDLHKRYITTCALDAGGGVIGEARRMPVSLEVQESDLVEAARRLNVSIEDLALAALRDLLARPEGDFERVASRVLEKNRELYRSLA